MKTPTRVLAAIALLSTAVAAQQYVISTYAGGAPSTTPAHGVDGTIGAALGVATDATGNVYFASADLNSVFKLDPSGVLTRVAGDSRPGYSGDGGPATSARLRLDWQIGAAVLGGVAVDSAGNLFIADTGNGCIRRVSPSGIITTVAGNGTVGYSGDGGPATNARLNLPAGVAVDGAGSLFIADHWAVRKVSASGIITTVAGNGTLSCSSADGGPATSAALAPLGVAVDSAGNLFIASSPSFGTPITCGGIRKVSPSGIITTVAGGGSGVAVDGAGNLFIGVGDRVRKVSPDGIITTVAGGSPAGFSGDGGPATSAQLNGTQGVAVDGAGNLFIATGGRIRKVSSSGIITTVAGNGTFGARLGGLSFSGDGGPATGAQLNYPNGVALDGAGNLFIADSGNNRIRKVSASGIIATVVGNGTPGFSGDGGPATSAQLAGPGGVAGGVAVDGAGNLFIADSNNHRIRRVSPAGIITTVVGNGTRGFSGDGEPATSAQLGGPEGVAVDGAGNLFIADSGNDRIRKVAPSGIITTVAGGGTLSGSAGDGGPATSAQLTNPGGVAVDSVGDLFIVDGFRCFGPRCYGAIRKVSTSGIITTVAGGGTLLGSSGDGGPATSAHLSWPAGVAVDSVGNLFIADPGANFSTGGELPDGPSAHRIRKVSPSGIITTVAGTGTTGFSSDDGPATTATLSGPTGVAVDSAGSIYIADNGNHAVRILRPTNQSVLIGAVVDAASQRAEPVSPGKIVVIYGAGLGPSDLVAEPAGTSVFFNGIAAPVLYTSATQVAAVVPYAITGTTARVTVTYRGESSAAFTVPVAASAPSIFTLNQAGWGQAAAINAVDGTVNTAAKPVRIGGFLSLYATGEGQTGPTTPPSPVLPVQVTVGGIPASVQYAGGAPGQVAGLMQVNVQIPSRVLPGGYVPVVLRVGDRASSPAVWIAISGN